MPPSKNSNQDDQNRDQKRNQGHSDLYDRHLTHVSRSFAFCIRELREPLRSEVGLAYLLCRILDTVEDSPYPTVEQKLAQIAELNEFILHARPEAEARAWVASLPDTMTAGERDLMTDAPLMFADLHALPEADRRIQQETVLSMSNGMAHYLRQSGHVNELRLHSLTEVNRYCFFVAGVVGELLTRTVAVHNPKFQADEAGLLRSHQFGLFLQKINLLKDQLDDEKVGRFLVPDQDGMWASLETNAQGAIDYILNIPIEERGYRLFCAWSLFLGLASIPFIKRTWARKLLDKIPRVATEHILGQVTSVIDSNDELRELFTKMRPPLLPKGAAAQASGLSAETLDPFTEFERLYIGRLSDQHLHALGMI